ncbi:glucose-6-phosphate isomerase [Candidatus Mycoplasma mahonii]|uniref:glucose-6-phosphate isomerase n=1 Tax=Candidatus Mycoplasma mahonii TaxID=3004105 RepID=UPI0026ECF663|nr:glucose-6-phosphate isomerase [Candidatus Mycoplasma mahonii]WKX02420.1 glucose-6-phosphate isomerase [Candidatus Mycoplasma mahonii]
MIKVDLSHAVTEESIKKYQKKVKALASKMENLKSDGYQYLGWKDLPVNYDKLEINRIKKEVKRLIKERVNILVVIGIGGSYAGAKAGIEMINGEYPIDQQTEVIYVGESLSSTNLAQKLAYVENKNFAINVISKSGTTTEPAIAFRLFKKLLEEKVGLNNANRFIIATTDANHGSLLTNAKENELTTFIIPSNVGGRFSVLTPVGLFPLAFAGINIDKVMNGALAAHKKYSPDTVLKNDAYRYAVARQILSSKFSIELLVQYEPQMKAFNEWWKQLAGESEGKNQKGIFPASAVFSTDLHSLGQFIQDGSKILFETIITCEIPNIDVQIIEEKKNLDNLNYLIDKTVHNINEVTFKATTEAHVMVGKVPNIHIQIGKLDAKHFGELVIFFERAVAMTAYLQGVNPFNQPGVEVYKQNMFRMLGKTK